MTLKSPYSGRPVKVRDQDIGRAIRDEAGRIFYVVPRSQGQGFYAARTRHGSAKEEQAYLQLETSPALQEQDEQPLAVHDATGRRRGPKTIVWVVVLLLLAAIGYVCYRRYVSGYWYWQAPPPTQPSSQPISRGSQGSAGAVLSFDSQGTEAIAGTLYDKTHRDVVAACPWGEKSLSIIHLEANFH